MIPVEKNKEYVACIDSVSSDGNGVAHYRRICGFCTANGGRR